MPARPFSAIFVAVGLLAAPAARAQPVPGELSLLLPPVCDTLTPQQAAAYVTRMQAALPGLIERRRQAAGRVLSTLAGIRLLDATLLDREWFGGVERITVGMSDMRGLPDLPRIRESLASQRRALREQTRELRALDLTVRMVEAWLPSARRCADRRSAIAAAPSPPTPAAPAARVPGAAAGPLAGTTVALRFSEHSLFTDANGQREFSLGDQYRLVLRFTSDGAATGRLENGGAPIEGSQANATVTGDVVTGGWQTPPGRVARFRITGARLTAGSGGETVISGQGVWCTEQRVTPGGPTTQYYGMIWGPADDAPPAVTPEARRLCGGN